MQRPDRCHTYSLRALHMMYSTSLCAAMLHVKFQLAACLDCGYWAPISPSLVVSIMKNLPLLVFQFLASPAWLVLKLVRGWNLSPPLPPFFSSALGALNQRILELRRERIEFPSLLVLDLTLGSVCRKGLPHRIYLIFWCRLMQYH